jgi:transcriptional regulator with XRE-family HTH domain
MSIGRIESAVTKGDATLVLTWDDGRRAELDMQPIVAAHPVLAPLRDPEVFHGIHVAEDGWSLEWPGYGIDFGSPQLRRWADEQAGEAMPATVFRAWVERNGLTRDRVAEALGISRRTVGYYLSGEQPVPKTVMLATEGYERRQAVDDNFVQAGQDRARASGSEGYEVEYFARKHGITSQQARELIREVSTSRAHLDAAAERLKRGASG